MDLISQNITYEKFSFTSFENERAYQGIRHELTCLQIQDFITNHNYTPTHFKYNRRKKVNAKGTGIIVLDIDEPQVSYPTLFEIVSSLKDINHILATTKSHQFQKNGIVCDRYRILLFVCEHIASPEQYKIQINQTAAHLNLKHDPKCVDIGRLFFKSNHIVSSNFNGLSFSPIEPDEKKVLPTARKTFFYNEADGALPASLQNWAHRRQLGQKIITKRERLIRILICQKRLLAYNEIPQEYMSDYLSIKRNTLKSWLDDLIKIGWLSIFSNDYGKGWKSKSYRADGDLAQSILEYHGFKSRRDCYNSIELPKVIIDGQWDETLLKCAFQFSTDESPDNFIAWFKSIKGWDQKTRLQQAYHAFDSMKKYIDKHLTK